MGLSNILSYETVAHMLKTPFDRLRVNRVYIEIIDFFRSAELVEA
jgi:hypothetical protein